MSRLWLSPIIFLLLGTANAQLLCDPLRWGNVSGWKGQFSETGNGTGTVTLSSGSGPQFCPTATYTNTQSITGAPVLQGNYPTWDGSSFSIADVNLAENQHCVLPGLGTATVQVSLTGSGSATGGDLFQLSIDGASCKYSLRPQNVINDTITATSTVCGP